MNWFSTYHVHHRVTEHFRRGRAFLLGAVAHIHSPAGGQGMNTVIGDAVNLAWKLTAVLAGHSVDLCIGHVMIDLVQEGFDLAITTLPPTNSTLVIRLLAAGRFILCCAPYLQKHPAPRCPADLAGHNCLRYTHAPFGDHWRFLDAGGNPVVARVSGNLITTSPETLRAAAIAGTGLVLLPSFAIFDLLASGALVPLLPDYQTPEFEIGAAYDRQGSRLHRHAGRTLCERAEPARSHLRSISR